MTWLEVDAGVRLRVADRRPPGESREPVVLVHGWKQSHRLYDRLSLALVERGHRVISYDHRGMGESDKPDGSYGFDILAGDLERVLRAHDVHDATLFGWSMGCTVMLEYLRRSTLGVGRAILHNGPLRLIQAPDFPHAMPKKQFEDYLVQMQRGWPASERVFQAESLLDQSDAVLLDLLLAVALQTPLDIALRVVRNQAAIDHRQAVCALTVPVLAAYADRDPYYPASLAQWIADHAPEGHVTVLKNSAHCAPLEEPERLAEVISDFAERAERRRSAGSRG
ncbi:alpha/beta fold hydrolase [Amycolatopsis sp. NPDC004368]